MLKWIAKVVDSRGFITLFSGTVAIGSAIAIFMMPAEDRSATSIAAVLQTAAVLVGLLSLILIARQIRASAWQAEHAAATAKALAYHQFFGDLITITTREQIEHVSEQCQFKDARKSGKEMTPAAVVLVKASPAHDAVVACYLDEFEEFCGAILTNLLDEDYSYKLEGNRVIRAWRVFKPYIEQARLDNDDPRTWLELQRVAERWADRRAKEDAQEEEDRRKVRELLANATGVQPAIPSQVKSM